MDNDLRAKGPKQQDKMTPEQRRKIVAEYVREKLRRDIESGGRGRAAQIARETGITGAHITNMTQSMRTPGPSAIDRLAGFWQIGTRELEDEALHAFANKSKTEQELALSAAPEPTRKNRAKAEAAMVVLGYSREDVTRWGDSVAATLSPGEDPDAETFWLPRIMSERMRGHSDMASRRAPKKPSRR